MEIEIKLINQITSLKIKPYLKDIIINLQNSDTWKIQLTIANKFISSKDTNEEHTVHSKRDNIEVMIYDDANEVTEELFESLLTKYQIDLERRMRDSDYIFDYVNLMKNNDDRCFNMRQKLCLIMMKLEKVLK